MKRLIYVSIVTLFASAILVSGVFADTPITNPLKWSQPPVWNEDGTINGWDVRSLYPGTLQAVDDWECKNDLPVTDIHWWGSYPGWTGQTPPPVRPTGFHFTMYKDVPVGPNNPYEYSHPGELIWEYQAHAYDEVFVGWDKHPYDPDHVEAAFQYYVDLPAANWFWQGDFAEAGTTITVTPHISEGEHIKLEYSITLNTFTGDGAGGIPPPRQTDEVQSEITIPDGHTLIVGGLSRSSKSQTNTGIPFIEKLPWGRYLGGTESRSRDSSTLFVFLKPIILRDDRFEDLKFLSERDMKKSLLPPDMPRSSPLLMK